MNPKKARRGRRGRKGLRTVIMERIGAERIEMLLKEAKVRALAGDDELAIKYVMRAKKIGMRLNLKNMGDHRGEFCKTCMIPFVRASKVRVRLTNGRLVITCLKCGGVHRKPYYQKKYKGRAVSKDRYGSR